MAVFEKRLILRGWVPALLATMVVVGCSRLPWSKSKGEEALPEGKTIFIDDLGEGKGGDAPAPSEKRRPAPPASKVERETPQRTTGEGEGAKQRIALAPTGPPDLTFSPVRSPGLKRKVCVLDFEDRTGTRGEKYGELAALRIYQELERTRKAALVDKEIVLETLAREGIEPEWLLQPHAIKRAHQILGIQAFITGSISDLQLKSSPPVGDSGIRSSMASVRLEIRLIDASTGNLLRTFIGKNPSFTSVATGLHSDRRAILKAVDSNIAQVMDGMLRYLDFLEWFSTVARVQDGKVFINAGRLTGLRVGNVLDVYEPGEEIINPITKFSLGWTTGELKGKVIITNLFGVDGSIAEPINGAGFRENDIVKIPQQNSSPPLSAPMK
jgi:hypothetical protein